MLVNWADWRKLRCCPHPTVGSRTWHADEAVHTETVCLVCGERLEPVQTVSDETVMTMLIGHAKRV